MANESFADRLRSQTKMYEKRLAAETMANIPETAGELAREGVETMRAYIKHLEQENEKLRVRVGELEKELDARS